MKEHIVLNRLYVLLCIIAVGVLAYALGLSFFAYSWSPGPNYRNVTVDTKVNITGSGPTVTAVFVKNPLTLNAGSITTITCNASVRDYNGFADIVNVNATVFSRASSSVDADDDNNTHYTNSSCTAISGQQSGYYANYSCSFDLNYYAVNGTWNCTVRANDTTAFRSSGSNLFNISALLALNVSPTLIDYGEVAASFFSDNISVNVTNIGDLAINVSVLGYANTIGDNLSFICDQGNLSVDTQHFSIDSVLNWTTKQTLSSSYQQVSGLTINKSINSTYMLNTTYWEFFANQSQPAFGNCTGFIVFQAGSA